jgi:hypothetical protein
VPFIAGPASGIPQRLHGKTAFELLSAAALEALVHEHAGSLLLSDSELHSGRPTYALRERLDSPDAAIARTANDIVHEYGTRLGYLLCILKRGDAESRAARQEWDESYWAHWTGIERVYLGGGLAWPETASAAAAAVQQTGLDLGVVRAPFAAERALIGAARSLRIEDGTALVLDFGQTATKRAQATYRQGTLRRLEMLPSLPASRLQGLSYTDWMAEVIATSMPPGASVAGVCVSSYLDERQHPAVYPSGGRFAGIQGKIENLREWLAVELSRRPGGDCDVSLFHDTTAAGVGLSPAARTAIVMLGTALGSGFSLEDDAGLASAAGDFVVEAAGGLQS